MVEWPMLYFLGEEGKMANVGFCPVHLVVVQPQQEVWPTLRLWARTELGNWMLKAWCFFNYLMYPWREETLGHGKSTGLGAGGAGFQS